MAEAKANEKFTDEEQMKRLAQQMREAEYKGLSPKEIKEREQHKEMKRKKNIEILNDTLNILENGCYEKEGQNIKLNYSKEQMKEIQVFLPDDIKALEADENPSVCFDESKKQNTCCRFDCENEDALVLAQKKYQELKRNGEEAPKILVLNLASATQPGGHTRKGAGGQEEDLCRRTSLLLSLESEDAKRYYNYNNSLKTRMGSDAVMLSHYTQVIKNSDNETLSVPFSVCMMTCSAPMVRLGFEGMSQQEYEKMFYKRICGLLLVAASQNYRNLILGAFGCGVYGNDAAVVSDLFSRAIRDFKYFGKSSEQLFDSVDFAVLCSADKDYNYKEFCRNFHS